MLFPHEDRACGHPSSIEHNLVKTTAEFHLKGKKPTACAHEHVQESAEVVWGHSSESASEIKRWQIYVCTLAQAQARNYKFRSDIKRQCLSGRLEGASVCHMENHQSSINFTHFYPHVHVSERLCIWSHLWGGNKYARDGNRQMSTGADLGGKKPHILFQLDWTKHSHNSSFQFSLNQVNTKYEAINLIPGLTSPVLTQLLFVPEDLWC